MILPALANDRRPAYMRISQNILPSNATVEHLICMPPPGGTQIYVPLDLTTVSATIVIVSPVSRVVALFVVQLVKQAVCTVS